MTNKQKKRFIAAGRQVWQSLTDNKRQYYINNRVEFLDNIARVLHTDICDANATTSEFVAIANELADAIYK